MYSPHLIKSTIVVIVASLKRKTHAMTITPAIRTEAEIDALVFSPDFKGGHVRRNNARRTMVAWNNEILLEGMERLKKEAHRRIKCEGAKIQDVRHLYAEASALELQLL